jgi:N-methylhydantoinase A
LPSATSTGVFLGGAMPLDVEAAKQALQDHVGSSLGLNPHEAASAVLQVVTENMVQLIEEISLNQGVDPRQGVLVGGGGAAGLNVVAIARRLGSRLVIIPDVGPVLSAVGALLSDLTTDFDAMMMTTSDRFDVDGANRVLAALEASCQGFIDGPGAGSFSSAIELSAHIRYPGEMGARGACCRRRFSAADVEQLRRIRRLAP